MSGQTLSKRMRDYANVIQPGGDHGYGGNLRYFADEVAALEAELALLRRAVRQLTNSNMAAASDLCHRLMASNGMTTGQAWDYLSNINIIHWERGIPRAPNVAPDVLELIKEQANE